MRRAMGVIPAVALALLSCQLFYPTVESEGGDGGRDATLEDARVDAPHDAGSDTAPEGGRERDAKGPCLGAEPPPPPSASSPTGLSATFHVAIERIWYDPATDPSVALGYNLDKTCTCEGTPKGAPSCVNDASPNCDGDGGRDLAGNELLLMVDSFTKQGFAAAYNARIAAGEGTVVLEVGAYDLGMDDQSVALSSYGSGGLLSGDGGPEAGLLSPRWDGTDRWSVDPRSFSGVQAVDAGWEYIPLHVDTSAYVTGYNLVARLDTVQLGVGGGELALEDAVLVASVQADITTGGHMLTGQIAGRLPIATLFAAASLSPDPSAYGGQHYCGSDVVFQSLILPTLCNATDIMSAASKDHSGHGCDAVSLAIGFVARQVVLGPPHEAPSAPLGCDGSVASCTGL